ncbi:MAG: hypothetical protein AAF492_15330 [Verrucomicrobiota bacterium]
MSPHLQLILLAALAIFSLACSKPEKGGTSGAAPVSTRFEDVPAQVITNLPIGSEQIETRYYTEDGAPIYTQPNNRVTGPVTRRTVNADGHVLEPFDGIRVIGEISHEDFKTILQLILAYVPQKPTPESMIVSTNKETGLISVSLPPDFEVRTLSSKSAHLLHVKAPGHVEVNTLFRGKGIGDQLEFRKQGGEWVMKILGRWYS